MSLPKIAKRAEWLRCRTELLAAEKELTKQRDALNPKRRELPMVEVEKDYGFDGPTGTSFRPDVLVARSDSGERFGRSTAGGTVVATIEPTFVDVLDMFGFILWEINFEIKKSRRSTTVRQRAIRAPQPDQQFFSLLD